MILSLSFPFVLSFLRLPPFDIRIYPAFFVRSVSYLAVIVVYHLQFLISVLRKQRMHTERGNLSLTCTWKNMIDIQLYTYDYILLYNIGLFLRLFAPICTSYRSFFDLFPIVPFYLFFFL